MKPIVAADRIERHLLVARLQSPVCAVLEADLRERAPESINIVVVIIAKSASRPKVSRLRQHTGVPLAQHIAGCEGDAIIGRVFGAGYDIVG